MDFDDLVKPLQDLSDCAFCPRRCHADRLRGVNGYCRSDASFNIASICIHKGEEPPVSGIEGICNIFFTNCNLQCIYCQNYQISDNRIHRTFSSMSVEEVIRKVKGILDQGIKRVGFVSPSHFIPQMNVIIAAITSLGYRPVWVYNTNGYDRVETIRSLEGLIDVYLPDFKYMENRLAGELSDAPDYPQVALAALKEMYRQKGSSLLTDEEDGVVSGMIVRHLVLPGHVSNSLNVIRTIAGELSPRIHISLMSQYHPNSKVRRLGPLAGTLRSPEYGEVMEELDRLGMQRGWIQDFDSNNYYLPDFEKEHPFESG